MKPKLQKAIESWGKQYMITIGYKTKYSSAKMEFSIGFFIEKFKKINRLLKGTMLMSCFARNVETTNVLKYFFDLDAVLEWAIKQGNKNEK